MNQISKTKHDILKYLEENPNSKVIDIIRHFDLSKQSIQKHLKELIYQDLITKVGTPPIVFYNISKAKSITQLSVSKSEFSSFAYIDAIGTKYTGYNGLIIWCNERGYNIDNYSAKWLEIFQKYEGYKKDGLINATNKFKEVFRDECSIEEAYFNEFSTREIFGKTSIYAELLLGKQTQDKLIFKSIFSVVKSTVIKLLTKLNIDYIVYVPPTVKREIQLMIELEKYLNIRLPKIQIVKVKHGITVPQKTLSKPSERRHNAIETFVIPNNQYFYGNVLVIDDFIGSGSSINYIAQKIKRYNKERQVHVYGYAIAGSPNGIIDNSKKLEIINEV
jgi:predicted amidophosphoribosyltransferase